VLTDPAGIDDPRRTVEGVFGRPSQIIIEIDLDEDAT